MIVIAAIVLNALWQDALIVTSIWLFLRVWPQINAATRYVVWSATLFAAALVPVATTLAFFSPAQQIATVAAHESYAAGAPVHRFVAPARTQRLPESQTAGSPVPGSLSLPSRPRVTLPLGVAIAVFAIWALLSGYAAIGLLIGLVRLERLKRDALPLPVDYRDSMPQWNRANKGRRPVRLCVSEAVDVPVAVGLFDAMILIPKSLLERLTPQEVEQISLHELAHLRRADDWSNCFQRVIVAALGWNPAAIFVAQQLELEREVACDDWVLSSVGAVRPYALCLTKMAETAAWPHNAMPAPGVFTTRKQISLRIERLLGTGRDIATTLAIGPAAAALLSVAALAIVITLVAPSVAAPAAALPPTSAIALTSPNPLYTPARSARTAKPSVPAKHTPAPAKPMGSPVRPSSVAPYHAAAPHKPMTTPPPPPTRPTILPPAVRVAQVDVDKLVSERIAKELSSAASQAAIAQSGGRSCADCDLRGVNWAGRDLRGANYDGVDFSGANLAGVNLSGSLLNGADFTGANLSGASFRNAHLTGCDFTRANLEGSDFSGARMSACDFTGATLRNSQLRDVLNDCRGCDFSRAVLTGLNLSGVRVTGDDFTRADLRNVNFAGATLVGSDFTNARLDGANLAGATLNGCDLEGVDLTHVDLSRTKIVGMDLPNRGTPP
ncbi:MAG: pentapeptide repeat-containing protein [Candidatus Cybelea sp.]